MLPHSTFDAGLTSAFIEFYDKLVGVFNVQITFIRHLHTATSLFAILFILCKIGAAFYATRVICRATGCILLVLLTGISCGFANLSELKTLLMVLPSSIGIETSFG